jgi:hypothetical protein
VKIEIRFGAQAYYCLVNHVPENSRSFAVLKNAVKVVASPVMFMLVCDPAEAECLVEVAKKFCSWALTTIENEIKLACMRQRT